MMIQKSKKTAVITKVEAVVGRAGHGIEGSSGRIYLPKAWIGKKVAVYLVNGNATLRNTKEVRMSHD